MRSGILSRFNLGVYRHLRGFFRSRVYFPLSFSLPNTAMWIGTSTTTLFFVSYLYGGQMLNSSSFLSSYIFLLIGLKNRVNLPPLTPKFVRCDPLVSESCSRENVVAQYTDVYAADLDFDSSGYTEEDRFYECVTYHRSLLHDYIRRWGSENLKSVVVDVNCQEKNSSVSSEFIIDHKITAKSRWPRNVPNSHEVSALECDLTFCNRSPELQYESKACQDTKFQIAAYYSSPQNIDMHSRREKGFRVIKELAEQGYADAMCYYGILLNEGTIDGVEANPQQAVVWWRRCVDEHGHINAMYEFATACYLGDGIAENVSMAVSLFRRAAHLGHAGAAYMLGECLLNGVGAERDRSDALEWLVTAAELGHVGAQNRVLMILHNDYGIFDKTESANLRQQEETLKWMNYDDEDSHSKAVNIERRYTIGGGSRNPVVVARRKSIVEESRNEQ